MQNRSAMQMLVAHLVAHGHKRIAFVAGQSGFSTARERTQGYKAALKAGGLAYDEALLVAASTSTQAAALSTRKLFELADPPTALAAGNNLATIGAMHGLRELGLRVPDDVALVGFDDFEWADYFEPRLTVIAQPCQEIGREAASLLDRAHHQAERRAPHDPPQAAARRAHLVRLPGAQRPRPTVRRMRPKGSRMSAPVLAMTGIEKSFGGVHALRGVDFDLRRGEVHALLGENGAGKSTLMNILGGVIAPDRGEVRVDGAPMRFANPRDAQASGIATIYQELDLVPGLDITANLFLGHELMRPGGRLDNPRMEREARARMASAGVEIDVRRRVANSASASGNWWRSPRRCPMRPAFW